LGISRITNISEPQLETQHVWNCVMIQLQVIDCSWIRPSNCINIWFYNNVVSFCCVIQAKIPIAKSWVFVCQSIKTMIYIQLHNTFDKNIISYFFQWFYNYSSYQKNKHFIAWKCNFIKTNLAWRCHSKHNKL